MQSKATTVAQYLAELPADRRAAIAAVRDTILKNLDSEFEEGMQYGMIGYYVPHRVFPTGYHCDPRQPLPFVCLASQKNHMSLYLSCLYCGDSTASWFQQAWTKSGKKLDMGKSCIRFKKLDDLALDVVAELLRRTTAQQYIRNYESALANAGDKGSAKRAKAQAAARPAAKKAMSKTARSQSVKSAPVAKKRRPAAATKARRRSS